MALVSIKTPSALVVSGNPIDIEVSCLNALTLSYTVESYTFNFSDNGLNSYFELKLNDRVLRFNAVTLTKNTGYEYGAGGSIEVMLNMFQHCAPLAENFDMGISNASIIFTSLNANTLTEGESFGIIINLSSSTKSVAKLEGTRIKLQVNEVTEALSKAIGSISGEPTAGTGTITIDSKTYIEGKAKFNIQPQLFREKRGLFSFPEEEAEILTVHNLCTEFKLIATSIKGFPPLSDNAAVSSIFALPIKVSDMKIAELNNSNKTFSQYLNEQQMWLSWQAAKRTDVYSTERLYYLAQQSGTLSFWVKKYYTNGTTLTEKRGEIAVTQYQAIECRSGHIAIKSSADNSRSIYRYEVWIQNASGSKLTLPFTYVLDFSYQPWARYFLFKNKFGAYEMLRTTGRMIQKQKIEKTFATTSLPSNFTFSNQNQKQIDSSKTISYVVNFGFTSTEDIAIQNDFLDSNEVYWLKEGTAVPVQVQSSDLTTYDDTTQYLANDFEIVLGLEDYSIQKSEPTLPIYTPGDFDIDFDDDFDF